MSHPKTLSSKNWFEYGLNNTTPLLWVSPPAGSAIVPNQHRKCRLWLPECLYVIAIPRLMPGHWHCCLIFETEFYFT